MEKRQQFTFYRSYFEALKELPQELRLGALEAVICYALDAVEPQGLSPMQRMAFLLIKPTLDTGRKKALAGTKGAKVTNSKKAAGTANCRQSHGKKENENEVEAEGEIEKEKELEIEDECLWQGFEKFWEMYPLKLGKDQAWEAWQQLRPDGDEACRVLYQWNNSQRWAREGGRFIPNPVKFLEERYFQQPPPEIPRGATSMMGQAELEAISQIMQEG